MAHGERGNRRATFGAMPGDKPVDAPAEQPAEISARAPRHRPNGQANADVPGMSEPELRALHKSYVDAMRTVGDARDVRYETLLASLRKQVPDILKKNQAEMVTFSVSVKDGKVVLRATPKREEKKAAP